METVLEINDNAWRCVYNAKHSWAHMFACLFSHSDSVMTAEVPSLLSDNFTSESSFSPASSPDTPKSRACFHHYLGHWLLYSEIINQWSTSKGQQNQKLLAQTIGTRFCKQCSLPPFLAVPDRFRSWRIDVDQRSWSSEDLRCVRRKPEYICRTVSRDGSWQVSDFLVLSSWSDVFQRSRVRLDYGGR